MRFGYSALVAFYVLSFVSSGNAIHASANQDTPRVTAAAASGAPSSAASSCVPGAIDPSAADCDTALIPDEIDALGNRTPLILIHGIFGNRWPDPISLPNQSVCPTGTPYPKDTDDASKPYRGYFCSFLTEFKANSNFTNQYKVFRFHYVSDRWSVWEIARSLRNRLDALIASDPSSYDTQFVLLAHSMGGLVARSYMDHHSHYQGTRYLNQRGGERILKAITLATPHHGSHLANLLLRTAVPNDVLPYPSSILWNPVLDLFDRSFWCNGPLNSCSQLAVLSPNRSDLLWDSFDGLAARRLIVPFIRYDDEGSPLPDISATYDRNITAYWGHLGPNYTYTLSDVQYLVTLDPVGMLIALGGRTGAGFEHKKLNATGVILQRIEEGTFFLPINALHNDGVVPEESAAFNGHSIAGRVECPEHDHTDMLGGSPAQCANGLRLLDSLAQDLGTPRPTTTRILIISPDPAWNYGNVTVATPGSKAFTLTNTGGTSLSVTGLSISGTNSEQFSIGGLSGIPFDLSPGATQAVTVAFTPSSLGGKTAQLTVSSNAITPTKTISLLGTGTSGSCSYTVSSSSKGFSAGGGPGTFTVGTGSVSGCDWTAVVSSAAAWIAIGSPTGPVTGTNSVNYTVAPNTGTDLRIGTILIQGGGKSVAYAVTQDGAGIQNCSYALSTYSFQLPSRSSSNSLVVTAPSSCGWTISSSFPGLTFTTPQSGLGTQTVAFSIPSNASTSPLIGTITLLGQPFGVQTASIQQAGVTNLCSYTFGPATQNSFVGGGTGSFTVTAPPSCIWNAAVSDSWITITAGGGQQSGTQTVAFSVPAVNVTRQGYINIYGPTVPYSAVIYQYAVPPAIWLRFLSPSGSILDRSFTSFAIGDALVGSSADLPIPLQDVGSATLQISNIQWMSGSSNFSIREFSTSVAPSATGSLVVRFAPSVLGSSSAVFRIFSNDNDRGIIDITVTGNGIAASNVGNNFVWTTKGSTPTSVPSERTGAAVSNLIYVLKGCRDNYVYDPSSNNWSSLFAAANTCAFDGGTVVVNGIVYLVDAFSGKILAFDPVANSWTTGAAMQYLGDVLAVAAANGKVYAIGGSGREQIVEEYDPSTNAWTRKTDMPTGRANATAAVVNNVIFVIGGTLAGGVPTGVVEAFDPASNSWTSKPSMPTRRSAAAAAVLGSKIYVIGGFSGTGSLATVEEYDTAKVSADLLLDPVWTPKIPINNSRTSAIGAVVNNKVYIIGGQSVSPSFVVSDVQNEEEGVLSASPHLNIPAQATSFGDVPLGTIGERSLTLQNSGNAPLTLTVTNYSGSREFFTLNIPGTIDAGANGQVTFEFIPTSTGPKNLTLTFSTNDSNTPSFQMTFTANGVVNQLPAGNAAQVVRNVPITSTDSLRDFAVVGGRAYVAVRDSSSAGLDVFDAGTGATVGKAAFIAYAAGNPGPPILIGSTAYVPLSLLSGGGQIAVVDTVRSSVLTYIPAGTSPFRGVAVGSRVYVADSATWADHRPGQVLVVDGVTNTMLTTITTGPVPSSIAVDPNTSLVYVADATPALNVIDPTSNTVVSTMPLVEGVASMGITAGRAYLLGSAHVYVVDLGTRRQIARIPVLQNSSLIAASNDFVAVPYSGGSVGVIDVASNALVSTLQVANAATAAVDPTTNVTYVLDQTDRVISAIRYVKPGFSVSCSPTSLSVQPGASATAACSVASSDGYNATTSLGCAALPAGVTCFFTPSQVTPAANGVANAALAIQAAPNVIPQASPLQVTVSDSQSTQSTNLSLNITNCVGQVAPPNATVIDSGGTGTISVAAPNGCAWSANVNGAWISIVSGGSGSGNGTISYSVAANAASSPRVGSIIVGTQTVPISQSPVAGGLVLSGAVGGTPGVIARIPVVLRLSPGVRIDNLTFGLSVVPNGDSPPLTGSLSFQQDASVSPPTLVGTNGTSNQIAVTWAPLASSISGTVTLGQVIVSIPSSAADGQSYTVQITAASASLGTTAVTLGNGSATPVVVAAGKYLVGDVYPYTGDTLGSFGDGALNILDLTQMLFAVNNVPGYRPVSCSDRFDAMDLYPVDTNTTRGGDGLLDVRDLVRELYRVDNLDLDRPQRIKRGGVCPTVRLQPRPRTWANAEGAMVLGRPEGSTATEERIPVYLEARRNLTRVALTLAFGDGQSSLRFVPSGTAPDLVRDSVPGVLAVAWLKGASLRAGERIQLGYVVGPLGFSFGVTVYGLSAAALDDNREIHLNLTPPELRNRQ